MTISVYPPAPHPIAEPVERNHLITRPWLMFFQQLAAGSFGTVAISGDGSVTAGTGGETLTLAAGDGIILTADPVTNTITISAEGGGFRHEFMLMGG